MTVLKCPNCEDCFGCILIEDKPPIYCKDCVIPRVCGRACSPIVDGFNFYAPELCPACKKEILDDYKPL